jgi:hypothetical protein
VDREEASRVARLVQYGGRPCVKRNDDPKGVTPEQKERSMMTEAPIGERDKAVKILAKSIFRELKMNGYETRQIVALSSELLGLVTSNIKPEPSDG